MPSLQLCCSAHDGAPRPPGALKGRPVSIARAYDVAPGRSLMTVREPQPALVWTNHLDSLPPTVLILGGFLTAPPMYRPLVERLRARGAAGSQSLHERAIHGRGRPEAAQDQNCRRERLEVVGL